MGKRFVVVVLAVSFIAGCGQDEPITIVPIGDSITHGQVGTATYRCYLDKMLSEAGVAFDFVGSQTKPYPVQLDGEYGCPHEFDQDHEGYTGARVAEAGAAAMPVVREQQPDVALIHLGSNDLGQFLPPADAAADLEALISDLQAAQPTLTILVAQIIPCSQPGLCFREEVRPVFHELVGSFAALSTDTSAVMVVDMYSDFDIGWLPDHFHPNDQGNQFIASQWMKAMDQAGLITPDPEG